MDRWGTWKILAVLAVPPAVVRGLLVIDRFSWWNLLGFMGSSLMILLFLAVHRRDVAQRQGRKPGGGESGT